MLGGMKMSFLDYCALNSLPGWGPILSKPVAERVRALADRETRDRMRRSAEAATGALSSLARWGRYEIGETHSPQNQGLTGLTVAQIAEKRGADPFERSSTSSSPTSCAPICGRNRRRRRRVGSCGYRSGVTIEL